MRAIRRGSFFFAGVFIFWVMSVTIGTPAWASRTQGQPSVQESVEQTGMTNADVIKMVQAGLGEDVVISAVRTAKGTNFQLDADSLIALKKAGVGDRIVATMLDPTAAVAPAPAPVAVPLGAVPDTRSRTTDPSAPVEVPRDPGIYVDLGGDTGDTPNLVALEPTVFSQGKSGGFLGSALTYGIKKAKWKAVVRNKNAGFRLKSQSPSFYFYFEQSSSGLGTSGAFLGWLAGATSPNEFILAKMEVKSKQRELIVGEFGAFGSSTGTRSKDTVEFLIEKLSGGIYRVRPAEPLQPGEYCLFYAVGAATFAPGMTGKLFDFGVDARSSAKGRD